jgi:glycosyltransferase involved in cell wall biosynthesis
VKLSVVIPVYQNAGSLPPLIAELETIQHKLQTTQDSLELILIDDKSSDGSKDIAIQLLKNSFLDSKHLFFSRNFGQIPAIQAGLAHSTGDACVITSADLQDPPAIILQMLEKWKSGSKFVIAQRVSRDDGLTRDVSTGIFWKLVRKYALPGYPSEGYDFCLIDRLMVDSFNRINEKNAHPFGLLFYIGFTPTFIPYVRQKREHGKSQWSFTKRFKLGLDTFIGFSYLPIRVISFIGLCVASASFLMIGVYTIQYFIMDSPVSGWTSIISVLLALGGLILLTLGILGEYLWRILDQVRNRPTYLIEKVTTKLAPNNQT